MEGAETRGARLGVTGRSTGSASKAGLPSAPKEGGRGGGGVRCGVAGNVDCLEGSTLPSPRGGGGGDMAAWGWQVVNPLSVGGKVRSQPALKIQSKIREVCKNIIKP